MAIKIKKGDSFLYKTNEGVLNSLSKKRADHIYEDAVREFQRADHMSEDILDNWYRRGSAANDLIEKHKIDNYEKKFFFEMLYSAAGLKPPERSRTTKNDFMIASLLASLSTHSLKDLRKVGSWGLWREIVGSHHIINDERVAGWVADKVINEGISRDRARPLLKYVRNRLKGLDTSVLSMQELYSKLDDNTSNDDVQI